MFPINLFYLQDEKQRGITCKPDLNGSRPTIAIPTLSNFLTIDAMQLLATNKDSSNFLTIDAIIGY